MALERSIPGTDAEDEEYEGEEGGGDETPPDARSSGRNLGVALFVAGLLMGAALGANDQSFEALIHTPKPRGRGWLSCISRPTISSQVWISLGWSNNPLTQPLHLYLP